MSRLLSLAAALSVLVACAGSPGEGKPAATVAEVPPVPADAGSPPPAAPSTVDIGGLPVPAISAATVLPVDAAASALGAVGAKITAKHPLDFKRFAGHLGLDGDRLVAVAFTADVASVVTDAPKLTSHLLTPDFFDPAQFPHATFVTTAVAEGGEGGSHTISGDLTIHGVTKRVTFPAAVSVTPTAVTATSEFVLNRKDFGIVYPGMPDDLIQDEVLLKVAFVAKRG